MVLLALDTSSPYGSLALLDQGEPIAELSLKIRTNYSEKLIMALETLLQAAGVKLKDVGGVAVGQGPGTFTGLRVGVGTAKALAFSLDTPLWGIGTLPAMIGTTGCQGGKFLALLDARQGFSFGAAYQWAPEGMLTSLEEASLRPMKTWWDRAQQVSWDGVIMTPGTREAFASRGLDWTEAGRPRLFLGGNLARSIGRLAWRRSLDQDQDDPLTLVPHYLKPSDAELKGHFLRVTGLDTF